MPQTRTTSLENAYESPPTPSRLASSQVQGALSQSSTSSSSLIGPRCSAQPPPAVDAVLTMAPPGGMRSSRPSDRRRTAR